jgi:hypothetical protein
LRVPRSALRCFHAGEFVHGGIADLTLNDLLSVQHCEPEGESFFIVTFNGMARQRASGLP